MSIASALRRALRPLRRATVVGPLVDAVHLRNILKAIGGDSRDTQVLGADEFAPYLRGLTPLSPWRDRPRLRDFDYVIVRQDHLSSFDTEFLAALAAAFVCTAANRRFAMFAPKAAARPGSAGARRVTERLQALLTTSELTVHQSALARDRAILVTTFNRPAALRRSLPQLARLGCPLLVVDDGSDSSVAPTNARIAGAVGADVVRLPSNRGLAAALNAGLCFLLADHRVTWISYFQDDVDVREDLMRDLARVEHPDERPLLTAYDADEHPATSELEINGIRVLTKQSSPAVHLHAHRSYWNGVLPIPTQYLGAPRRRWEASLEDYWIVNNAPRSVGQRGLPVICLPGGVRTFLYDAADSTWDNPNRPDPPLSGE